MICRAERHTVLVIDDEIGPRESLRFLLKNDYDVVCADCVDQGVMRAREKRPDLIVLDIRMPGKNGIEGLRELRKLDDECSIIMLTGFGALETAQQALRLGANDYINKPFDTNEMRDTVRHYVTRTSMERRRMLMLKELHDMNTKLVEDLAEKDALAHVGRASAEFAHDLRNPLMIVSGYVQLLSQELEKVRTMVGQESGRATSYLGVIESNVRRCGELAQGWQKMGKGDLQVFERLPVKTLLEDMKICIEPLAVTLDVSVEFSGDHGDRALHGSRPQLIRALYNVVANAIDAVGKAEGKVRIACTVRGCTLDLTISDNGCGMAPEVLQRMFEPYFTTKPEGKGTGLGTVIARRIVEEHGGAIDVQSTPGVGTEVSILLPLMPASVPAAECVPLPV